MERMAIVAVRKESKSGKIYLGLSLRGGRRMGVKVRARIISRCAVHWRIAGSVGMEAGVWDWVGVVQVL